MNEPRKGDLALENGWVVEFWDQHTCGTGVDGYYGAHEPGCGWAPVCDAAQWMTAGPYSTENS